MQHLLLNKERHAAGYARQLWIFLCADTHNIVLRRAGGDGNGGVVRFKRDGFAARLSDDVAKHLGVYDYRARLVYGCLKYRVDAELKVVAGKAQRVGAALDKYALYGGDRNLCADRPHNIIARLVEFFCVAGKFHNLHHFLFFGFCGHTP